MFDRIMQDSMAIWVLISALFPIFMITMIVKAVLHARRMRAIAEAIARDRVRAISEPEVWTDMKEKVWAETNDWVPSP